MRLRSRSKAWALSPTSLKQGSFMELISEMKDILPEDVSTKDVPKLDAEPRPEKRESKSSPGSSKSWLLTSNTKEPRVGFSESGAWRRWGCCPYHRPAGETQLLKPAGPGGGQASPHQPRRRPAAGHGRHRSR